MERNWTVEQRQAIEARGGMLLVSAAAGSGKTAVLVERVVSRLTDDRHPCDADRLLVVTFTNAAAAEMRERISQRIGELAALRPWDRNLARQQILLQNAHISTIHAFCLNLVRENFEKLDISPDFRIADENEMRVLIHETLSDLLEEKYATELSGGTPGAFLELAGMLGAGRDDRKLEDAILRLYDFLRSLPDPEDWLDRMLRMYKPGIPAGSTLWGRAAIGYAKEALQAAIGILDECLRLIHDEPLLETAYGPAFISDRFQLCAALEKAEKGDWGGLYKAVNGISFERLGSTRGLENDRLKEVLKSKRDDVKELVKKLLSGVLSCDEEDFQNDLKQLYPLTECLFEVVRLLDKRLFEKKQERNILDFSDLEHLALRLLTERTDEGLRPSAAAEAVSARFEEVLVDEYQDTNPAQEAIFACLSRQGRNLFMVGDVKQSIYRFRQASPEIFIAKKEAFPPYGPGIFPSKITLGRNFRSRSGIAETVNFLFGQLMSKRFGEIEYDKDEMLIPAAEYPPREGADFALHIVDTSGYEDGEDRYTLEARHIASIIRQLVAQGFPVKGENGTRPVRYRDFCILLRSTTGRVDSYARELEQNGIPVYTEMAGGYFGSYEVAVMLSLLRIIDNPLQDVPLLSVMLSPVFGFTPDDLADIRIQNRRDSLYLALVAYAKEKGGRFSAFLERLESLRRLAAVLPADKLILRIFSDTGFLHICEAMPSGKARRANLRMLLEYARNYEAAGYKGLDGFLRFIDRVGEQEGDLAPASSVSETADVVRIMSIHRSKGLEFPICILADCAKQFNWDDLRQNALFHPVYGFGPVVRDKALDCRHTTLAREVVKIETERSSLAEEMRILYVAMTRAKEKLYCVMTLGNHQAALKKASSLIRSGEKRLDAFKAAQVQSIAYWILASALRHPDAGILRKAAEMEPDELLRCPARWEVVIAPAQEASPGVAPGTACEEISAPESERLYEQLRTRLEYVYPWRRLSRIPSKLAVTELTEKPVYTEFVPSRPAFMGRERLTAAQAGTALHRFMQSADLSKLQTRGDIEAEIARLVHEAYLLKEEGEAINRDKVMHFLQSEICRRVLKAQRVWREFRFNIAMNASDFDAEIGGSAAGEKIVIQGMTDLVFCENGDYYILDYKTDNASADELRRRYTGQLDIYARAVSEIMGKTVKAKYIYGFRDEMAIIL